MNARRRALLRLPLVLLGALAVPFRRMRHVEGLSGDAAQRRDEFLSLTGGVARAMGGARLRSLFRSEARRAEIRQAAMERATAQAVEQLGNMKGLSMKLGQMMSYINVLSEEGEDQMSVLQSSVPPMDFDLVRAVIEDQLGELPEIAFARFDPDPIAAASVGQVHRAALHDGREVVVKVQYPGVDDAFRADLANMQSLTDLSAIAIKSDLNDYLGSLSASVMAELDYQLEQANQQRLADLYRDHPFVLVPDTVPELCRPRVLVSDFVDGARFREAVATSDQATRDRIGEVMYRFAFGCIMNGFFSGDPHPGNYLYPADGRVCFLDFGMVMEVGAPGHASVISQVIAGALEGRQDLIDDGLRVMGFLPEGGPAGAAIWREVQNVVAGPIDEDVVSRLDRAKFAQGMKSLNNPRSNLNQAFRTTERFESWAALSMRYAVGALAAISKFAPEGNWRHIIAEIVLGEPPQTEIGRRWGDSPGGADFIGSRFRDK